MHHCCIMLKKPNKRQWENIYVAELWLLLQKYTQQPSATGMQMRKSSVCILHSEVHLMPFHLSHSSGWFSPRKKLQQVNDSHIRSNKPFLHTILHKYMLHKVKPSQSGRCCYCYCFLGARTASISWCAVSITGKWSWCRYQPINQKCYSGHCNPSRNTSLGTSRNTSHGLVTSLLCSSHTENRNLLLFLQFVQTVPYFVSI